jgi:hypothetical protein
MSKFLAAVNTNTGRVDYFCSYETGAAIPYGYGDGLSEDQVAQIYDEPPDPATQKDDGSGNLIAKTQNEIDADEADATVAAFVRINDLPVQDPVRLQYRALWCIAKKAGECDADMSFVDFLAWIAADQEG